MKVIEFIKKSISVYSLLAFLLLCFILFVNPDENKSASVAGWIFVSKFFFLVVFILLILLDFLFKNIISSRIKLNCIELIILLIPVLYLYFII
mgnify:CR=1 FL=1